MEKTYLSIQTSLSVTILIGLFFIGLGYLNSKKISNNKNYIVGDRDEDTFSLTASLTASALGAWILFGPASAATWGGIGAVIGYSLGTAAPMLFLYNFGPKIRKEFPKGLTLTEFIKKRFGTRILKISLILILFYLTIFLIAEVTAIAYLLNFISQVPLWLTAGVTLIICLLYILRGGFKLSIITDKYQFSFIVVIILMSLLLILGNLDLTSYEVIKKNSPNLIDKNYLPNYTAGLTFFIAVAATNLFHQGNWQRVYAAKNYKILKQSLLISFFIIIPIVFFMGFTGMVSFSMDPSQRPDLGFFTLLLKEQTKTLSLLIITLGLALTISTVDTLVNAISSLFVIDGKATFNLNKKTDYLKLSKYFIIIISLVSFFIASKGFDILYLFLLADLFCCAFVYTVFYSFYNKDVNERAAYIAIIVGLIGGFLLFPFPDFSKSLLVGVLISKELFSPFILQSLLFLSFVVATFLPAIILKLKKIDLY